MGIWQRMLDREPLRRHQAWLRSQEGGERLVIQKDTFEAAQLVGNDYRLAGFFDLVFTKCNFGLSFCMGLEAERCTFERCEWEFAKLDGARLTDCTFQDCHMVGVHFEGTRMDQGRVKGGTLSRSNWSGAVAERVDFSGVDFGMARLATARFIECDFSDADFEATQLDGVVFEECNLTGATWKDTDPSKARFVRCKGAP